MKTEDWKTKNGNLMGFTLRLALTIHFFFFFFKIFQWAARKLGSWSLRLGTIWTVSWMFGMVFIPLNYLCVVRWVQICGIIPLFNVMTSFSPWHYRTLPMIQILKCIKTLNLLVNALIIILIVVQCATDRTLIPN